MGTDGSSECIEVINLESWDDKDVTSSNECAIKLNFACMSRETESVKLTGLSSERMCMGSLFEDRAVEKPVNKIRDPELNGQEVPLSSIV
jgi:hypothetical protein